MRISDDLYPGCSPRAEARALYGLLSTGSTIEELRALIAVPPKTERVLRAYAEEDPGDAIWIEAALKFRLDVSREFERLVHESAPEAEETAA